MIVALPSPSLWSLVLLLAMFHTQPLLFPLEIGMVYFAGITSLRFDGVDLIIHG
jgi:hypothetical protein